MQIKNEGYHMKWIHKYYTHQYYKITADGEQRSIYDSCKESYILHIHHDDHTIKYHFISGNYEVIQPYKVLGLSIQIRNKTYLLPPQSFIIKDNVLFDRPLLRWLCIYYLGIMPADTCKITAIDDRANLYCGNCISVNKSLEKDIK